MIETYDTTNCIDTDKHPVRHFAEETEQAFAEIGYHVDLTGFLAPPEGSRAYTEVGDCGLTPTLSDDLNKALETGLSFMTIKEQLTDHFGKSRGQSNVTKLFEKRDMDISELIRTLDECGQIEKAVNMADLLRDRREDPSPEMAVAYGMFRFAKGWYAERVLLAEGEFKAASIAQDKGGIDLWAPEEKFGNSMVQVKAMTYYNSGPSKSTIRNHKAKHLFYQFDERGMHVATLEDATDMNKEVASHAGLSATLLYKSVRSVQPAKDHGRSFRFLWW